MFHSFAPTSRAHRLLVFSVGILLSSAQLLAQHPSFDCGKAATPAEYLICSDGALAAQDSEMANDYKMALQASPPGQQVGLRNEHRRWFNEYAHACNAPMTIESRRSCIASSLGEHIKFLKARMGPTLTADTSHPVAIACAVDSFILGGAALAAGVLLDAATGGASGGTITITMWHAAAGAAITGCISGAAHQYLKQNGVIK